MTPKTKDRRSAWCVAGLILLALSQSTPVSATFPGTVINTYPDWDGNITSDYSKVAQSFLAPADNVLQSWEFHLASLGTTTNLLFQIVPWSTSSGPVGSALFSRSLTWPTAGGDMLVGNINLALTPGSLYAVVLDLNGYRGNSVAFEKNQNSYADGNAAWYGGLNPGWLLLDLPYNTEFQAQFTPAPEPASVFGLGICFAAVIRSMPRMRVRNRARKPIR